MPDSMHHNHMNHCGRDFPARIEANGFSVEGETGLLQRSRGELLESRAFSLHIYNAWRRRLAWAPSCKET